MPSTSSSPFQSAVPLAVRREQSDSVRAKHAGKIPVIVELHAQNAGAVRGPLPRQKYLVTGTFPALSLRDAIREDLKLPAAAPLHVYVQATAAALDYETPLAFVDEAHRDAEDGFLYAWVSSLSPAELLQPPAAGDADAKKSVPYLQDLLARTPVGAPASEAASGGGTSSSFVSPHGERVPEGATIASCTFLNPRATGARLLPELTPSCGGRVPPSLYVATLLDVTAVGLVVPLLAAYSRALGAGPRFTGLLQATYGLTQLVGANLLGGLSDTVGRRRMLQLSSLGGAPPGLAPQSHPPPPTPCPDLVPPPRTSAPDPRPHPGPENPSNRGPTAGAVGYTCLALSLGPPGSLGLLLLSRVPIGLLKQSLTVSVPTPRAEPRRTAPPAPIVRCAHECQRPRARSLVACAACPRRRRERPRGPDEADGGPRRLRVRRLRPRPRLRRRHVQEARVAHAAADRGLPLHPGAARV